MNRVLMFLLAAQVSSLAIISGIHATEPPGRDLSRYDLDGPYSLDRSFRHEEDQPVLEAAIRDFLWTRWCKRRLAHLSLVQYGLEGLGTRVWYFIEPDRENVWRLVVEQDITLPAVKPEAPEEHVREWRRYEIYLVERVPVEERNNPTASPIADDDRRPPAEYRLRLKNKKGDVISQL